MSPDYALPGRTVRRHRSLHLERLENRIYLSGEPILADPSWYQASEFVPLVRSVEAGGDGGIAAGTADETEAGYSRAAEAINRFAFDLYKHFQQEEGNLFLSPMSIATALAMTYAGARGETASEMADVLHLGIEPGIHDSFRRLLETLDPADDSRQFDLDLANALWPQEGFPFRQEFLRLVESRYGGSSQSVDYTVPEEREAARNTINAWVEENTHGKIKDLIPQGALDELTRLVLTNAIYFKGQWLTEFDPAKTEDRPFHLESGETIDVPTMYLRSTFHYCEQDGFQVLEMPYEGENLSMAILLPREGTGLDDLSGSTLIKINDWLAAPSGKREVIVRLPKFETTVSSSLSTVLKGMGMPLAFDTSRADFSAMAEPQSGERLFIDKVLHKAFVEVNEEGTEAAAATAVIGGGTCFAAGTPLLTPDGQKPIEKIHPGDYVLSRDQRNVDGQVEAKLVEEAFVRESMILNLHIAGQLVRTTKEHPFYVQHRGWTAAGRLQAGDLLATDNGRWLEVEKAVDTGQVETVYNLRVADYHTYFVAGEWGAGLWAHNTYGAPVPVPFTADHPFHFYIRDNQTGTMLFMGRIDDPLEEDNSVNPEVGTEEGDDDRHPGVIVDPGDPASPPEGTTPLGPVDFLELSALDPSGGDLWFSLEPVHHGLLTVEALTSDAQLALYDADFHELTVSSPADGIERFDWLAAAGESLFLKLTGDAASVDLRLANLVRHVGTEVTVYGTDGADWFEFDPAASRLVTINGVEYRFVDAEVASATFDGGDGDDVALLFADPNGANRFETWPGEAELSGNDFLVRATSVRYVHAYGNQGPLDVALLHGDPNGLNRFEAWPDHAKLRGDDYFARAKSFRYVHAYAGQGPADVALLHGDPNGPNRFEARPDDAKLRGDDYFAWAHAFRYVHAYGNQGPADVALLRGDPNGPNRFEAWPNDAKLRGDDYFARAKSFRYVHAYAGQGPADVALLHGNPNGPNRFEARPDDAKLRGDDYFARAKSFRYVHTDANRSGSDEAVLYDSALTDYLEAADDWVKLRDAAFGFFCRASGYDSVKAHSTTPSGNIKRVAAIDYILDLSQY